MAARLDHPDGVHPLLSGGRRVVVDDHPICATCGRAVQPTGPHRWRHVAAGRSFSGRSKWLAASEGDGSASADEWREGRGRLEAYQARLRTIGRRRRLGPNDNPYLELVSILGDPHTENPPWGLTAGLARVLDLPARRRELVSRFAWSIPTDAALDVLARHSPLVECGAGTGYWAALLQARGVDVVAFDATPPGSGANAWHAGRRRPWTDVPAMRAVAAARRHPQRTLLLCWPSYDDDAASYDALRAYRGPTVIHIGDPSGASGSVRFHRELELNWTPEEAIGLVHWPAVADRLVVYRRNAVRRPHRPRDRCDECGRFIPTGSIGRCQRCFERHPPALALAVGRHRIEYSAAQVAAMPPALRLALEASPHRVQHR